ncbi:InlB B-repeat-containing protein [Butyrivibrio sp. WCE2006]|uniref:InlB B-repeat-containing protein n=1 Tax=Butyrivibrio sp. WCE2006 TaxID=1410611 RepID=UPI0005D1D76E|nr:InlB B-repeat-containing protein [Butyrivibrio sp. WCE2006]
MPDVPFPELIKAELPEADAEPPYGLFAVTPELSTGPHYRYLSDMEQSMYRAILQASTHVYDFEAVPGFSLPYFHLFAEDMDSPSMPFNNSQFQVVTRAVRFDHPELVQLTLCSVNVFYLENKNEKSGRTGYDFYIALKSMVKGYNQARFNMMEKEFEQACDVFLSDPEIQNAKSDVLKELAVHDKLIDEIEYDYSSEVDNTTYHLSHTAYGSLINKTSVCDGYAGALSYLLKKLNIDTMIIAGYTKSGNQGNHAWNIVCIDGEWYEVDPTWNDPTIKANYSETLLFEIHHLYYNLTTDEFRNYKKQYVVDNKTIKADTMRIRRVTFADMPKATGTQYSFANVKKILKESMQPEVIPVTGIELSDTSISAKYGQSGKIGYKIIPSDANDKNVSWFSSDNQIVSIEDLGEEGCSYKVVGFGKAKITASMEGGIYAECIIDNPVRECNVSFDLNGGTGEVGAITRNTGDKYGVLPNDVVREGYEFAGWFTDQTEGQEITEDTYIFYDDDVILYAHWNEKTKAPEDDSEPIEKPDPPENPDPSEEDPEPVVNPDPPEKPDPTEEAPEPAVNQDTPEKPDPTEENPEHTENPKPSENPGNTETTVPSENPKPPGEPIPTKNPEQPGNPEIPEKNPMPSENESGNINDESEEVDIPENNEDTGINDIGGGPYSNTENSDITENDEHRISDNSVVTENGQTINADKQDTDGDASNSRESVTTESVVADKVISSDQIMEAVEELPKDRLVFEKNESMFISSENNAIVFQCTNKKVKNLIIGDELLFGKSNFRITEIGSKAYKNCKKLKSVKLGRNISKIGKASFSGCKNLSKITVYADNLRTVAKNSFKGIKANAKFTIICKDKKTFNKARKMFKKAGASKAEFKFKKLNRSCFK